MMVIVLFNNAESGMFPIQAKLRLAFTGKVLMGCNRLKLLQLERGVRRVQSTVYIPLIPTPSTMLRAGFSLWGRRNKTYV
jgi:hypothetical protein